VGKSERKEKKKEVSGFRRSCRHSAKRPNGGRKVKARSRRSVWSSFLRRTRGKSQEVGGEGENEGVARQGEIPQKIVVLADSGEGKGSEKGLLDFLYWSASGMEGEKPRSHGIIGGSREKAGKREPLASKKGKTPTVLTILVKKTTWAKKKGRRAGRCPPLRFTY